MFREIVFLNWKASRLGLLPFLLAAFGLPLVSVQGARVRGLDPESASLRGSYILDSVGAWAHLYPALAFALGTILALMVWNWDHRGEHVYPLSLPLPRWRYVLLKMGAGGILLLGPVFLLWVGSLLAVSVVDLPDGLRVYPTAVTVRFLLASLLSFVVFFALAAGTMRMAIWLLVAWILLVFLGETLPPVLGDMLDLPGVAQFRFVHWILNAMTSWPGPFQVFTGNWMLIDV